MSGWCALCGTPLRNHGTACKQSDLEVLSETTDHADDNFESARIRRIVREELERAKGKS